MDLSKAIASVALLHVVVGCAVAPADPATTNGGAASQAGASSSGGTATSAAGTATSAAGTVATSGGTSPGTAGTSATGGGGGTSPSTCPTIDPMALISDFETGKAEVVATAGRDGSWFLYNDGTGMQMPVKVVNTPLAAEAGGACGSAYAFHTTGMGFVTWGAGIGTDFAPKTATVRTPYDLSAYTGIALRAKSAATVPLRVSISDTNTSPEGMQCHDTTVTTDAARCGDYFGAEIILGAEFQDFTIKFADMKQRGFGLPVATGLAVKTAFTVRMQVKGSAQAPASFDLWFDDVRLVP